MGMRQAVAFRRVLGFVAWLLAGGSLVTVFLGAFSVVSLWALATGVVAIAVAIGIKGGDLCAFGLVSGAAIPLFYVAWANRKGPGEVCVTTQLMVTCVQELSPWAWLAAAFVLFPVGIGMFWKRLPH